MIEAPASKSFTARRAVPERKRISPLLWMNLVCLDAPAVAVSWQWLFARAFHVAVPHAATAALFLTAWFIYLADRFGDSISLDADAPMSLRQRFCLGHMRAWITVLIGIALADVLIVATKLDALAVIVGGGIAAFALVYLTVNRLRPDIWRVLHLKEISIGFIFAAGTMVGLLRSLTSAALPAWILFASLCSLNCISIAVWERGLDVAQKRISIATEFPRLERYLAPVFIVICLTSLSLVVLSRLAWPLYACITLSAFALRLIHLLRNGIDSDVRTALADLVLLTPLLLLSLGGARF
jgi:hypothetical protein